MQILGNWEGAAQRGCLAGKGPGRTVAVPNSHLLAATWVRNEITQTPHLILAFGR